MRAIDVMVRDVVTVSRDTDVAAAIKLLAEHDVSALPVLDKDGNLVGVLSEADLIHRAEITAAATIAAADGYGLPVSTTHVLSSGIAGTMSANGSGLQWSTVRNIAMAWVLTLPMAMMLSAGLYVLFVHLF